VIITQPIKQFIRFVGRFILVLRRYLIAKTISVAPLSPTLGLVLQHGWLFFPLFSDPFVAPKNR